MVVELFWSSFGFYKSLSKGAQLDWLNMVHGTWLRKWTIISSTVYIVTKKTISDGMQFSWLCISVCWMWVQHPLTMENARYWNKEFPLTHYGSDWLVVGLFSSWFRKLVLRLGIRCLWVCKAWALQDVDLHKERREWSRCWCFSSIRFHGIYWGCILPIENKAKIRNLFVRMGREVSSLLLSKGMVGMVECWCLGRIFCAWFVPSFVGHWLCDCVLSSFGWLVSWGKLLLDAVGYWECEKNISELEMEIIRGWNRFPFGLCSSPSWSSPPL